jgi:uroporphyrinogen III methyltransferase/synthase
MPSTQDTSDQSKTVSDKTPGVVYLVGAGPGHPGLITRWGYELLQRCDAVAYDALIPMELIAELPEKVEKYYVGKRAGKHSVPQPQINELLVSLARRGLNVVRLKGGDPFIYGRSGEEKDYLAAAGIPVVMIPGVTAASAAAALSGFSLTNRQESSWVFLATGHGAENTSTPVPWDKVGTLPGGTLVIYMGLAKLDHVIEQLLSSGLSPEIPAVAVQAASTGLQRCVEAPLARISSECKRQKLKPPALVIISDAIRSRSKSDEKNVGTLAGKTVLVTSPSAMMIRLCTVFRQLGAEPIPHPTVRCTRVDDDEVWRRFQKYVNDGGVCIFQSETEVGYFVDGLLAHGMDLRNLNRFKVVAFRESTGSALRKFGIQADRILQNLELQTLIRDISDLIPDKTSPLIWVHGDYENGPLEAGLRERFAEMMSLAVCRDSTTAWDAHWVEELKTSPPDYITFTSAAEVEGFVELLGEETAQSLADRSCVAAMDDSVLEILSRYGLSVRVKTNTSSVDAFVGALIEYSKKQGTQ